MPAILDNCVQKLIKKGMSQQRAFAICTAQLQKGGKLKKGTNKLTAKGKKESAKKK